NLAYQVLENGILGLQASYAITHARQSFASNDAFVVRANYAHSFQLPSQFGVGPLIVSPVLYRIYSWSAAANPAVDPTVIPAIKEWRFGVTGELGLTNNLSATADRKSTRLNSSHLVISYAVFCLKKKKQH